MSHGLYLYPTKNRTHKPVRWPTDGNYTPHYEAMYLRPGTHPRQLIFVLHDPSATILHTLRASEHSDYRRPFRAPHSRGWFCNNFLRVHGDDLETVRLGLSFGLATEETVRYLDVDPSRYSHQDAHIPAPGRALYKVYPAVKGAWSWTNEAAMVAKLKEEVTEGLLEKVQALVDHHSRMAGNFEAWPRIRQTVYTENTIEAGILNDSVSKGLTSATYSRDLAILHWLKLRVELSSQFAKAKTFKQTLDVCARYIDGTFGVDWFTRGFFHPFCNDWEHKQATEQLDRQAISMQAHMLGSTPNPLAHARMTPFWRLKPDLARMYGQGE